MWGNYWSSVQKNSDIAYSMDFNSSGVRTDDHYKKHAFSVRCVRQEFTALIFKHKLFDIRQPGTTSRTA